MRYAIVSGNTVQNVISWDGVSEYEPPEGTTIIKDDDGWSEVGGHYENGRFYPPKPFPSWTYDEASRSWLPPEPYPNDGMSHVWDESTGTWWPVMQA